MADRGLPLVGIEGHEDDSLVSTTVPEGSIVFVSPDADD
jgi:hypothetical protein